ncbi:MAG: DnaJ domain-containing protein [Hyphomicrobiaceae bacterium]
MQYFLIGLAVLFFVLLALHAFRSVNTARLARVLRAIGGVAVLAGAAVLGARGAMAYAIPLAMAGFWLLFGGRGMPWSSTRSFPTGGNTSRIVTDHLEMELDHDTGMMRGRVLKGVFAGRAFERLAPAELALMWRDCKFADPKSAQIIEAWLDQAHPTWREDMSRAESEPGAGGIMTRAEAYEILGLRPGASEEQIRQAHRDLMMRMHPDRGGSDYLASKINEAKDLLLGK